MSDLSIYLFGTPRIEVDGSPLHIRRRKAEALLAYLAVNSHRGLSSHSRDALANLLWPGYDQTTSRDNLRRTLSVLVQALNRQWLEITRTSIALPFDATIYVDTHHFYGLLANVKAHDHANRELCASCLTSLNQAVDLYKDDFLTGFTLADAEEFDEWQRFETEGLRQDLAWALEQLVENLAIRDEEEAAIPLARRWVALDPLHEPAQRQLMQLYAQIGQQAAALRQYAACVEALKNEMNVEPSPETIALYEQLQAGQLAFSPPVPAEMTAKPIQRQQAEKAAPFHAVALPPHFVGRLQELDKAQQWLCARPTNQASARLLALIGMGGVGKTTLAAGLAHKLRTDFADGVLWVNVATSSPYDILELWGRVYGYDFSGLTDLESRATAVRGILADKETLIVLDNVADAALARLLLPQSARCAGIITTRSLEVAIALNAEPQTVGELSPESSQQLLTHIVGETRVYQELYEADELGALLHYLPLAIEIAAQRLKSRPRMKIGVMNAKLQDAQQRLGLEIGDLAVRTSFQVSWEAMKEIQQRLFTLLAVFEGRPFVADVLAAMLESELLDVEEQLDGLVALSLLQEEKATTYRQHPLLADFADEKLRDRTTVYRRFADYYYDFVCQNVDEYERLRPEWGNIQAAIRTAYRQERWPLVIDFARILSQPWLIQSRYDDACQAYAWTHEAAQKLDNEAEVATNLVRWGKIAIEQNEYEEAKDHLTQALRTWMHLEEDAGVADAQFHLARIAMEQGQYVDAEKLLASSLALRELLGDVQGIAAVQYRQASIFFDRDELARADDLLHQALAHQEAIDDQHNMIPTLRLLAQIAAKRHAFALAHSFCVRAQTLCEELQDGAELATVYYTLAIINRRQANFDLARAYAQQALPLFQKLGLRRLEGMVLYQLSVVLKALGEYQSALHNNLASIKLFETVDNPLGKCFALLLLGDLYDALNQSEACSTAWLEAEEIAHALNHAGVLEQLRERKKSVSAKKPQEKAFLH